MKNQIDIFKIRSLDSIRAAQEFGIEQDLIIPNISGTISFNPSLIDRRSLSNIRNIEIEQARQLRQNIADHLDQRYSKLSDMFLSMDKNRAGTINVNELRQVCRNFNLDDRAIEKVIAWCDMDHNNVLSYDEFCKRLVQYDEGLLDGSNVKDNIITPQVGRKINF